MNATAGTYASYLARLRPDVESRAAWRRLALGAAVPLVVVLALAAAWSALAPLAGAVIAPAELKVEHHRRAVQHQEGGLVREILVRDGQQVRQGDPLLVIGDLRAEAALGMVRDQLQAEVVRRTRASAEAALQPSFAPPAGVPPDSEPFVRERALFAARRRMLDDQVASLELQIREARAQAAALESRIEATESAVALSDEEVAIHDKLARQGFIQRTRLIALERTAADYRARAGEYRSELALARQRIGELQARIAQARSQYQGAAADELRLASAAIRELELRLRPSEDQTERQVVRAPVDGEVMNLRPMAAGTPVAPREPLLEIVPARERIVVEARVRPQDIDYVRKDGAAEVRLAAFDARDTPLIAGRVTFVSADRVTGERGEAWYVATLELDADALARHGELRLTAGMPAEVFVTTPARTLVDYLTRPLHTFAQRGMREP